MPGPMGGIGQQVADNLFELGKSTVKSAVKAGGDLATGTMEQLVGAPSGAVGQQIDKPKDQAEVDGARRVAESKQKDRVRYQQVKAELEQFRSWHLQMSQKKEQELQEQNQAKRQEDAFKKQEKESFVQKMLRKVGAGAYGETVKQKE